MAGHLLVMHDDGISSARRENVTPGNAGRFD
jgi:hypothetical protein